jgi:DNA-binding transcriptional ArsR family regulator
LATLATLATGATGASQNVRLDRVYGAIADPTRRAILAALAGGDANVGTLVDRFPISFNGVSKHVKVLERAGLIERTVRGREHLLHLRAAPLRDAVRWLEHYRGFWDARLEALEKYLVQQRRQAAPVRGSRSGRSRA